MKKSVRILASLLVALSLLAVSAVAADIFLGDTNGDGKVNNLDATNVLKYDAGINDSIENGDYNEDGITNNLDAAAILKYDAGIVEENTNVSAKYVRYIPDEYMPVEPYGFAQSKFVIHSVEELRAYLGERHELYDYGYRLDAPEPVIPFYPYYEYDEEYFKDNILLLLLIEEPSGSIRNRVKSVTKNGEELDVLIECYSPAMRTDDMAYWTLFIELDKSYDVTPDKINVNTNIIDIDNTVDA